MTKQNAFTREDLLRCSRGELFGPGNAQLPAPNMLMVDRITLISEEGGKYGKGELVAELDITPDLWFFACHFEGAPVMPGCLGLGAMWLLSTEDNETRFVNLCGRRNLPLAACKCTAAALSKTLTGREFAALTEHFHDLASPPPRLLPKPPRNRRWWRRIQPRKP